MAMGIGQQLKGMVRRARNYWSELTDEQGGQKRNSEREKTEAVHQRYGGVGTEGEARMGSPRGDRASGASSGRGGSDAQQWDNPAGRSDQPNRQPGSGQVDRGQQMHAESQTSRQYTQQGGSGIQKTLGEQTPGQSGASGTGSDPDTVRSRQSRRPGQQNH